MGKTLEECYEILGLDYGAAEDEIKSAYRKKALQCHPDKNPDDPLSTQKFQELGHAYRRLTGEEDSDSDDEYDDDDDDDDDDMDLWRKFFFFLFRDEILQRAIIIFVVTGLQGIYLSFLTVCTSKDDNIFHLDCSDVYSNSRSSTVFVSCWYTIMFIFGIFGLLSQQLVFVSLNLTGDEFRRSSKKKPFREVM